MKVAHESQKGAIALDGQMIDAPMIKQVRCLHSLRFALFPLLNAETRL